MSENDDLDLTLPADEEVSGKQDTALQDESADAPVRDDVYAGSGETEPFKAENPPPGSNPYFVPPYPPYAGQNPYARRQPQPPYYYPNPGQPYYVPPQYTASAQFGTSPPPPTKGKRKGMKVFFAVLSILVVFSIVLSAVAIAMNNGRLPVDGDNDVVTTTSDGPELNINETPTVKNQTSGKTGVLTPVEIAEKVKPSVVGILTYSNETSDMTGEGSGIIMGTDATGKYTYVVTCAHVISENGISISIQLENGTRYEAERVGYDLRTDVGVVKVKKTGLPAASFGNSGVLKVGEQVFAVGNPGGTEFFGSFTAGMVSAIDRPVNSEIGYTMELIQHDAAINPGNSGGALVNIYGQVIGINSLKIIDTNYEGMGFAIPISSAKTIVDSIIKFGYVPNRPKLGITYLPVSANEDYNKVVQIKGYPAGSLIIDSINADSSLAKTDARKGDIILAANGKNLDSANVLLEIIDKAKVGDTLTLRLCRVSTTYKITEFTVKVKLVEDRGITLPKVEDTQPSTEETTDLFDYFEDPFGN